VSGVPVEWDEHEINARFSLVGSLSNVHFVRNAQGSKNGKVVIDFDKKDSAD